MRKATIRQAALLLVVGATFGFGFFQAAHKSWPWAISGLLALVWGGIGVWFVRRATR